MSVFSPDVNIDSPVPLPIEVNDGTGNPISSTTGALNVDVINFPAIQPISGSVTVLNASIPVTGTFWQAVQPVSGTFWQAIQPVSGTVTVSNPGLTDTELRATPVPVSGTLTANQGTSPWVVSGSVSVSNFPADADALAQGSSTAGQLGALEMGATTTAAPTYVTGTTNPLSLDVAGNLRVSSTITNFPATVAVTQSTSPWVVSGTITTSPNVNVHDGAGNTIASTGTSLNVDVTNTVPVTGTFWQATQPVSGTFWQTTQPISGSVSVSNFPADADALAQGSTTAGQLGALTMGAVTTANPTYVTGQTDPLSLDTLGNLRVYVANPAASLTSNSDTVVQITSTGANQTILAANAARKKAILYFESGIWYVKFGAGASAASKTYGVSSSNTTIEVPVWIGQIDAFCTTAGKLVDITEMV